MRALALAALLPACSLAGLFDGEVVREPCRTNDDCETGPFHGDACVELFCDDDAKCAGRLADADHDEHAPVECVGYPADFLGTPDDCDDGAAIVHGGATERCDGVDNDCDGEVDEEPDASDACAPFACESGRCGGRGIVQVSAGCEHTCAVLENGGLLCWGSNDLGQILDQPKAPGEYTTAIEVPGIDDAVHVAAGNGHTCVLDGGGHVTCFGQNDRFQRGDGTVVGIGEDASLVAGYAHTCVRDGGGVWCWGWNEYGQLGDGADGGQRAEAMPVVGIAEAVDLSAGAGNDQGFGQGVHTCAITGGAREVWCWGWNGFAQLGTGRPDTGTATPIQAVGVEGAVDLAAGPHLTCAARADDVVCWGWAGPPLGTEGDPVLWTSPTPIAGVAGATQVAVGLGHACAVADGVWCWGSDDYGQIGNGRDVAPDPGSAEPVTVGGLTNVTCGCRHTCAIDPDGVLLCWGANEHGQLGNGRENPSETPTPVEGL